MGADSKIEWCDHTFNPHWGCQRVSPGCENCYAETFTHRLGLKVWGAQAERREFGDKHWNEPRKWNAKAKQSGKRQRVFCASMADVFEDHPVAERSRARLFPLIDETPHLDWLLLTKRPENIRRLAPHFDLREWPNVWLGCTVEDQKRAEQRIPHLLRVPAAVRFLSCEPLLEKIDILKWLRLSLFRQSYEAIVAQTAGGEASMPEHLRLVKNPPTIDWVIVGGESGRGARPFNLKWALSIVEQCRDAGVAAHVKQLGAKPRGVCDWKHHDAYPPRFVDENGTFVEVSGRPAIDLCHSSDDSWWPCAPKLKDRKGGDWSEWPDDLKIREYPKPEASRV